MIEKLRDTENLPFAVRTESLLFSKTRGSSPNDADPSTLHGTLTFNAAPTSHTVVKLYTDALSATAELLWPILFALALVIFRAAIGNLIQSLANRIRDPHSNLKIGPLELSERIDVLESKVTSQVESEQVDRQVLTGAVITDFSDEKVVSVDPIAELRELSSQYLSVDIPDWAERVQRKDYLAARMAKIVIECHVSRELLARDPDEGLRIALATAIHTSPRPGDDEWIAISAPGIQLKHVRYRFMMAIARLAQLRLLNSSRKRQFIELSERYLDGADEPLKDRIRRTIQLLIAT